MRKRVRIFLISLGILIPLQIYLLAVWLPEFLHWSKGLSNLDSRFGYNAEDVNLLLKALGQNGIRHYFIGSFVDVFYAAFMSLTIFSLFRIVQGGVIRNQIIQVISMSIPLIYLGMDWTENIGIFISLISYPTPVGNYISWFSYITMSKQLMSFVAVLNLIALVFIRVVYSLKKRKYAGAVYLYCPVNTGAGCRPAPVFFAVRYLPARRRTYGDRP